MHGKNRADYKEKLRDSQTAALLAEKAQQWHQLMGGIAKRRSEKSMDHAASTLQLLEKALVVNPDPLYLWNHRREWIIFVSNNNNNSNESSTVEATATANTELRLTQAALQRNPKAYGAWMHRKWTLQFYKLNSSQLEEELPLTAEFLRLDERNFHCWNYRRFVVSCLASVATVQDSRLSEESAPAYTGQWDHPTMGIQLVASSTRTSGQEHQTPSTTTPITIPANLLQSEWDFTTQKIQTNFSNFSAFYYRSQLLPNYLEVTNEPLQVWENEFQMIENAVFTEPDDQTVWWYQAMLLSFDEHVFPMPELKQRLMQQVELLQELLEDAPDSKWVLIGLHRLLDKLQMESHHQRELLWRLQQVDPDRTQRYQQLLDQIVD